MDNLVGMLFSMLIVFLIVYINNKYIKIKNRKREKKAEFFTVKGIVVNTFVQYGKLYFGAAFEGKTSTHLKTVYYEMISVKNELDEILQIQVFDVWYENESNAEDNTFRIDDQVILEIAKFPEYQNLVLKEIIKWYR